MNHSRILQYLVYRAVAQTGHIYNGQADYGGVFDRAGGGVAL